MFSRKFVLIVVGILASFFFYGCGGKSKSITVTPPTPLPISVTVSGSKSIIDGTNSATLSAVLTNDTKAAGVSWSVNGGGTLSGSTTSGTTYTAAAASSAALTVTVTATSIADASKSGTATITVPAAPAISTASLAAGTVGTAYSAMLTGSGGIAPYSWSLASGSTLPTGLNMSTAGVITGVPMAAGAGIANVTLKMTDSGMATALSTTAQVALTVNAAPAITFASTTLPSGTINTAYTSSVAGTGGVGNLTYSILSGQLPAGLTMSAAGAISGTPSAAEGFSIMVQASDVFGDSAKQLWALKINYTSMSVTTKTLPQAFLGISYSTALSASGGTGYGYTWAVSSGSALPAGLTLSNMGVLSGKPTESGTDTISVTVTDPALDTATATLPMIIDQPGLTISTAKNLAAYIGSAYSLTMKATGGSGTGYTWALSNGSAMPAGFSLSTAGVLTGNPTLILNASFTIIVTDSAAKTGSATFSLNVATGVAISTLRILPEAIAAGNYYTTLSAVGGSGTGYNWTVSSGSTLPDGLSLSPTGTLRGNPTSAGTYTFGITVTDSASSTASGTFSLTVTDSLRITTPATLQTGYTSKVYALPLAAAGGTHTGYTWTVTSGEASLTAINLGVSAAGLIAGTPMVTGTALFTVQVTDSFADIATATFTLTVSDLSGPQVRGKISLTNNCGQPLPPVTVSLDSNPAQTATTDTNGNYTFTNVPNGNYTITPSIVGPSSVFNPATITGVTMSGSDISGENFGATLGYRVSGTVTYAVAPKGTIYVTLSPTSCSGSALGTAISTTPGAFTIQGVPPGVYRLDAWMDVQNFGFQNQSDPAGTNPAVAVSTADLTGEPVALLDPTAYTLSTKPTITYISPADGGVIINFKPLSGTSSHVSQIELPIAYTVEWSTDPNFVSPAPASYVFKAGGANGTGVWLLNNDIVGLTSTFTNTSYSFRVRGETATGHSDWTTYPTPVTVGAPTRANTVTGSVTFAGTPTEPLYVGFVDMTSGIAYTQKILSPRSPQAYSIQVPSGTNYFFFGEIDQNNNGMIDTGDISNTRDDNSSPMTITGDLTKDLTLSTSNSKATVTTQHFKQTSQSGSSEGYNLAFEISEANKLPISVSLLSGNNVLKPIDLGKCLDCGHNKFRYNTGIAGSVPNVGDPYGFNVTYSDGTSETVYANVSAVVDAFATTLSPSGAGSTTPTFTWTYPADSASYVYQFYISDNNGSTVWQIPGNNSKLNGFPNSVASIVWGKDPTSDVTNTPSVGLTSGLIYNWQIQVQDVNGNSSQTQVDYLP